MGSSVNSSVGSSVDSSVVSVLSSGVLQSCLIIGSQLLIYLPVKLTTIDEETPTPAQLTALTCTRCSSLEFSVKVVTVSVVIIGSDIRGGFRHVSLSLVRDTLFLNSKLTASFRELSQQLTFVLLFFDFEMEPTITSSHEQPGGKIKIEY